VVVSRVYSQQQVYVFIILLSEEGNCSRLIRELSSGAYHSDLLDQKGANVVSAHKS